jgi:hypothetical protein
LWYFTIICSQIYTSFYCLIEKEQLLDKVVSHIVILVLKDNQSRNYICLTKIDAK